MMTDTTMLCSRGCKSFSSDHRRETLEEVARLADAWVCTEGEVGQCACAFLQHKPAVLFV
jgi:hypothetical protein